ncbi:hypothetical protein [Piscinibacter sp. XHJ-5]|uniref:hypothetical protein n=1 Tax=Piscinibacter sp. XHJ-5 TaxID=3037797 RepID=UPI002452E090|nr:hypothetical protein [Piscinibacter sp. XHJ-5]
MKRTPWQGLLAALAMAAWPGWGAAHDYPTVDRVMFVEACMQENPGPHFEMQNKCSCALDNIAARLPYDDFVSMSTATNATSIGGERGSYIRDVEALQKQVRDFRQLRLQALKSCFITPSTANR